MNMIFLILSAIVLVYWIYGMARPNWQRPKIIRDFGLGILFIGAFFLILGIFL